MIEPPPLSLYIHFPWCIKKCPYCDFNSHPLGTALDQSGYIQALVADLDLEIQNSGTDREIQSIFMGGGTPSLFSPSSLEELLAAIRNQIDFSSDIEITMEANPGTDECHDIGGYRQAGINRLSVGVQSFDQGQLTRLGRIHSPENAIQVVDKAKQSGFDNINIDLMFGLPNQSSESALADLESGIALEPTHLSLYQLTIEPNTVFSRYPPRLPNPDDIMQTQLCLHDKLAHNHYSQYEVSAFCRSSNQSRHNVNYWQFGDYIGIGAGAHGKITRHNRVIRRSRKKHPGTYLGTAGSEESIAENRVVKHSEILLEFLMNALRLNNGFDVSMAESRTGVSRKVIRQSIAEPISKNLLIDSQDHIRCSEKGFLFIDEILAQLL